MAGDIKSFTELKAWQYSHKLVKKIYLTFEKTPKNSAIKSQIERSSLSITSNIAEGFGRESFADKKHFYVMARGSAYEVQNQLILSRDTGCISKTEFVKLSSLSLDSIKLLHGLIRSMKKG
jgi:four helix bundle protein